ncbi:MAG: hypothetical protein ACT4PV_15935 [Planctomycetaceae bacterium]
MSRTLGHLLAGLALVAAGGAARAADEPPLREYDQRAAAALFTMLQGQDFDFSKVDRAAFDTLQLKSRDFAAKQFAYGVNFGSASGPKGDSRGALKITVGIPPPDPVAKGWTKLPPDAATGAERFFLPMKDTEYARFGVRLAVGGIVLAVEQRKRYAAGQDPLAPAGEVTAILAKLLEVARVYKLLRGEVKLTLLSDDAQAQPLRELGAEPLRFSLRADRPSRFRIRVEVSDAKEQGGLSELRFRLAGSLATFGKLEVPGAVAEGEEYILKDPGDRPVQIALEVAARSEEFEAALLAEPKEGDGGPGLRILVDPKYR